MPSDCASAPTQHSLRQPTPAGPRGGRARTSPARPFPANGRRGYGDKCGRNDAAHAKGVAMNLGIIFLSEMVGTAMLVLLGCGVVANVALVRNKGHNGGFLMVNIGWGLAVFAGVIVSYASGAHLNPAVTLGITA